MARTNTLTNFLTDVADSIREKTGKSDPILCEDFDTEIESISGGGEPNLQDKTVTITTNTTTTVTADTGYDGLDEVEVITNVATSAPRITNASYLFYNNARSDAYNELMACLSDVTNCSYMFSNFTASSPDVVLNKGELNALTNTGSFVYMFEYSKVASVVLSSTSTVLTTFANMFNNASVVTSVDLSGITVNASNLPSSNCCSVMFANCYALQSVKFPVGMFTNATKGTGFTSCFQQCNALQYIDENTVQYFIEHFPFNYIATYMFSGSSSRQMPYVTFKTLPDTVTHIQSMAFQYCTSITQFSANNVVQIVGSGSSNGAFTDCRGLKAVWIGSSIVSGNTGSMGRYTFNRCNALEKIYINLPRATVETFAGYTFGFMNNTAKVGIVVCNDDAGWIDKATFDATTW